MEHSHSYDFSPAPNDNGSLLSRLWQLFCALIEKLMESGGPNGIYL